MSDETVLPTAASVQAEIDELDARYKSRRKVLRALLAVLLDKERDQ